MNLENILPLLPKRNRFVTVRTDRPAETRKGFDGNLRKVSVFQLRVGHSYYAQRSTRAAHESGERAVADPSTLWHEPEGSHPALVRHKADHAKIYLAGQPAGNKPVSTYLLNGEKVEFEQVEAFLLASEKKTSNSDWKFVKIESITSIR